MIAMHNALQFALFLSLILYSLFFYFYNFGALCCSTISTVVNPALRLIKFADDTYLLIPASHSATIAAELDHVTDWAATCNLKLNSKKTFEMVIRRPRGRAGRDAVPIT